MRIDRATGEGSRSTVRGNRHRRAMVRVEVSFLLVELRCLTDVDYRLAQALRVTSLPIRTTVIMSQVSNDELRVSDLDAHDIVDDTRFRDIMQCHEITTGGVLHLRQYSSSDRNRHRFSFGNHFTSHQGFGLIWL